MKLLYLKEHLSCINYQVAYNTGFVFCELRKEENSSIDNESSFCVIFLLYGKLSVDYGNNHIFLQQKLTSCNKKLARKEFINERITKF